MGRYYRLIRRLLIWISLIIGCLFMAISFVFLMEPYGQVLGFDALLLRLQEVFNNHYLFHKLYFVTAIIMFLVAIPQTLTGLLMIARIRGGMIVSIVSNSSLFLLMLFFSVIFPSFYYSWIILGVAVLGFVLGILCIIAYYQYNFYFNVNDYPHVNQTQNVLVVYYALNDYIKKHAYSLAERFNGSIYQIETLDDHSFGEIIRSSVAKKTLPIKPIRINLTAYTSVYLITPVWFNAVASPVLSFCNQARGKIVNVEYDFVYYHALRPIHPIVEIDNLLKIKRKTAFYTKMHYGEVKKIQLFR